MEAEVGHRDSPTGGSGGSHEADATGRDSELRRLRDWLDGADRVVLTTHVNADGDGAGSQIAMLEYLRRRGTEVSIVNPTPFPRSFEFLLEDDPVWTVSEEAGRQALSLADLILVLDTSEASRLGEVADSLAQHTVGVMDHHPATPHSVGDLVVRDPEACATGELVYDLITLDGDEPTPGEARGLYVAIVTDTGSFRFGNTSPRAHEITADLLRRGVDVEEMFRLIHARYTRSRLRLLRRALDSLEVDDAHDLAWITLTRRDLEETDASAEDREGLVEYARRLQGVEVAVLFRELAGDRSKISLRSNGDVDVASVARELGGGGHPQAAGILMDRPLSSARAAVLERLRAAVSSEDARDGA